MQPNRTPFFLACILLATLSAAASPSHAQANFPPTPGAPPPLTGRIFPPPLPPLSPSAPEPAYFVEDSGQPRGPFNMSQLEARARAGGLTFNTLIWKDGMADWAEAGRVEEVAGLIPAATPGTADEPPASNRFDDYLTGSWELTASSGRANESTSIDFNSDGRYEGAISSANEHGGSDSPVATAVAGQWKVSGIDNNRFTLTLKPAGNGQERTASLRIVDENTLYNETVQANAYRISP